MQLERYRFNLRQQETNESFEKYVTALRQLASKCDFGAITPDELLRDRILFGIHDSNVRERLLRVQSLTLKKTLDICRAAEISLKQLKEVEILEGEQVNLLRSHKTKHKITERNRANQTNPGIGWKSKSSTETRETVNKLDECKYCGRQHEFRKELCPAYGKTCSNCKKPNHFAAKCMQGKRPYTPQRNMVRQLEEEEETDDSTETFQINTVNAIDDSQLVTLKIKNGNFIRFQLDTGAQCNVLPIHIYKAATKDVSLKDMTAATTSSIISYGGIHHPVIGQVKLKVWRGTYTCYLMCNLVEGKSFRPILGRRACLGMKIVEVLDNDAIRPADIEENSTVYTTGTPPLSTEEIVSKFPAVFQEGIGRIEGQYNIKLDPTAHPVQHAPRRVPVAIRDKVKAALDDLVKKEVIAEVKQPTKWISSMVTVPKKNGQLRICLDPKDLNAAIQREHYPLPVIEDVATRLHGARTFSVLDASNGFLHVELDEQSSLLTTLHRPFGRFIGTSSL